MGFYTVVKPFRGGSIVYPFLREIRENVKNMMKEKRRPQSW
jgi:hypothetical protein